MSTADSLQDDREREQQLNAIFENDDADSGSSDPDASTPSHLSVALDEDGEPEKLRFVYVDEHSCIGCTYCTQVARSTFMLEPDNGRARVFSQGGDTDDIVEEAIDTCPVNCINWVSFEDLVTLERERAGHTINNKARLVNQQEATSYVPETASRAYTGMRCNNCPSRGCKECPMFGVGANPVYLERAEARRKRKEARGELALEQEQERRAAMIQDIYEGDGATIELAADAPADTETEAAMNVLFSEPVFGWELEDDEFEADTNDPQG